MTRDYDSRFIDVHDIRTHYLEAGVGNDHTLVLIHAGEYGASAEMTWKYNMGPLSEQFHVIAPDLIGFGHTDKLFDFEDAFDRRMNHLSSFLDILDVTVASFAGISMGAGYLASLACEENPLDCSMEKLILATGGGGVPDGFEDIMHEFDGTKESMDAILDLLVYKSRHLTDEFIEAKTAESRIPGHWQCLSAIRFDPPFEQDREFRQRDDFENIHVPTLIIGGKEDELKPVEELRELADRIPDAECEFFDECGHNPQIEHPHAFNNLVYDYLRR
jgi:pimeloyl-ACP methyl ester carboxylesterase